VDFSSADSFDPQDLPLTFFWDFGDGDTSNAPNPGHRYKSNTVQTFNVSLKVTNSAHQSSSDNLTITVGSVPPVPTILSPADGTSVQPGDTLSFQGSATDPDDGNLQASALSWTVLLHHNDHVHSFLTMKGAGGNFVVTDHGPGTYSYEFILTATDSSGLTQTDIHHVKIETPCIFCRDFDNGVPTDWTLTNDWSAAAGDLIGNATMKKAKAIATPAFAGCSSCFIETEMSSAGGEGNRLSLFGWYESSGINVELLMKEESDRWILKQRSGNTTKKSKAVLEIQPNVKYPIRLVFDGNTFQVFVGAQIIITMPKIPGSSPFGTVGFQVKKTIGKFGEIGVH
jgi:hypothetical protein